MAHQLRPWEVSTRKVFNYLEGAGTLTFFLRGSRVLRVTQPEGWMKDRTRFLHDAFRRQRLVRPEFLPGRCRHFDPLEWDEALTYIIGFSRRRFVYRVDPGVDYFFWLLRTYDSLRDDRGPHDHVVVDTNRRGLIYHGAFFLRNLRRHVMAIPLLLTYEEEGVLLPPRGGRPPPLVLLGGVFFQIFAPAPAGGYRWTGSTTPREITPREGNRALFQVSPLHRLLGGW